MTHLTRPGAPPPLVTDGEAVTVRLPLAPDNLVSALDRAFENRPTELARRPGRLTDMINSLPARERDEPACPRLVIAVLTSRTVQRADLATERPAAETAMLAHWNGRFHNNNHRMVTANGFNPSLKDIEELGEKTVQVLRRNDLIRQGDSVIDVGTGKGFIAKHLAAQGVKVEAIEPGVVPDGEQIAFPGTEKLTAKQYVEKYAGKQFSVVHVANFSPCFGCQYFDMDTVREVIRDLGKMTSDDGTTLIGISSMDPQFVSGTSEYRLRPHLSENFDKVEYLSAKKLGEEFSIGGQMGVFKCSEPKRKNQAAPSQ